jgi:hypothetical protein
MGALLALSFAGAVTLWRTREGGLKRTGQLTVANLAINLVTYGLAVSYYTIPIPISLQSLWSLLFAGVMGEGEAIRAEAAAAAA